MTRDGDGKWLLPDGDPFKLALLAEGDTRAVMGRGAAMIVENWVEFGIDATPRYARQRHPCAMALIGDFDAEFGWTIETWGGHPDLFFFLQSWHSDLYRPSGRTALWAATGCAGRTRSWTASSRRSRRSTSTTPRALSWASSSSSWRRPRCRSRRSCPTTCSRAVTGRYWERVPDLREPLHQSGSELGQQQVYVREDQAEGIVALEARLPLRRQLAGGAFTLRRAKRA